MTIVFIRTLIFYFVTIISLRIMGKRQLGELETPELVVTILISELATMSIQDTEIPIIYSVIPIVTLSLLEIISSEIAIRSVKYRNFISGDYSIIIDNGILNQKEMLKSQVTIDEVMEQIRQKGAMTIDEVRFCILETSGKMSVVLKKETEQKMVPTPLIVDGHVISDNLAKLRIDRRRFSNLLKTNGVRFPTEVFWLSDDGNGRYTFVRRDQK